MMSVAKLHKLMGALIENGHGRKPVCIDKRSFTHALEDDGAVILNVGSVDGPRWIGDVDDDGGSKVNRDGSEAGRKTVILLGERNG